MHDEEWNASGDERDPWTAQFGGTPNGFSTPAIYRPAADDSAPFPDTEEGAMQQVLNFFFPVYIEAVGALGDGQIQQIADVIFDALNDAISAQV
jgi:hypothetical protein